MCSRCTEKRYASLVVTAAQQNRAKPPAAEPSELGTESASSDTSSGDEDDDEHMKEFYAESVDRYIIRSDRKSPALATSGGEPTRTRSDKVIFLEWETIATSADSKTVFRGGIVFYLLLL